MKVVPQRVSETQRRLGKSRVCLTEKLQANTKRLGEKKENKQAKYRREEERNRRLEECLQTCWREDGKERTQWWSRERRWGDMSKENKSETQKSKKRQDRRKRGSARTCHGSLLLAPVTGLQSDTGVAQTGELKMAVGRTDGKDSFSGRGNVK